MTAHTETPWSLIPQHGAGPVLARIVDTTQQMAPRRLRLIAHILERGDSLEEDKANGEFILLACNVHEQLVDALQQQHKAIDVLMAQLIVLDPDFFPTKSSVWPALMAGGAAMAKAGVK